MARMKALTQRNKDMADLYESGMTLHQIGDRYGITRERVRQILNKSAKVTRGRSEACALRSNQIKQSVLDRREEILATYRETGDVRRTVGALGLSLKYVREVINAGIPIAEREEILRQQMSASNSIDREQQRREMVAALIRAREELGDPMSSPRYDEWAIRRSAPRAQLITIRFEGWNGALAAAGLPIVPSIRGGYTRISDEELLSAVRTVAERSGRARPSVVDYNRQRELDSTLPSLSSIRNRRPWTEWLDML